MAKVPILVSVIDLIRRGRMNESYDEAIKRQVRNAYFGVRLGIEPSYDPTVPQWDNPNNYYRIVNDKPSG